MSRAVTLQHASTDRDGGPAFPTDHSRDASYANIKGGMSLRDYFAAKALVAVMSGDHTNSQGDAEWHAAAAYRYADAMLKAREQT